MAIFFIHTTGYIPSYFSCSTDCYNYFTSYCNYLRDIVANSNNYCGIVSAASISIIITVVIQMGTTLITSYYPLRYTLLI